MKPTDADKPSASLSPAMGLMAPTSLPSKGFPSLRTKFVLFFTIILAIACSTLSWYFIENRREAMADNLQQLGTILLANVVRNEHFPAEPFDGLDWGCQLCRRRNVAVACILHNNILFSMRDE